MQDGLWETLETEIDALAPNTQIQERVCINLWCGFLGVVPYTSQAAKRIKKATKLDALRFIKWLEARKGMKSKITPDSAVSTRTIHNRLGRIRYHYHWLIQNDIVKDNPFKGIDLSRYSNEPSKRPTGMIDKEKVREILNLPDRFTCEGIRDRAMLAVLFAGGLRSSELRNLILGDIRKTLKGTCYLYLRKTKAGRPQSQALSPWAATELGTLFDLRKRQNAKDSDLLFVRYTTVPPLERKLTQALLQNIFCEWCEKAGVTDVSPHWARATAGSKMLIDGCDYKEVKDFLRHSSVRMVEVYDKRLNDLDESKAKNLAY